MKDIQEIMNELNNLTDQTAVTLDEENIGSGAAQLQPVVDPCVSCNNGTGGIMNCNDLTLGTTVPFVCNVSIPDAFNFPSGTVTPRILYDLNCLNCFVEECICDQILTRYAVRVVGSIPFIINVPILRGTNQCLSDGDVFACCNDSVCVDNTICFACSELSGRVSCELIKRSLTNCAVVRVTNLVFTRTTNPHLATVSGIFNLPLCSGNASGAAEQ